MASLVIILTKFANWQAPLLFGDPNQLAPYMQWEIHDELRNDAKLSVLGSSTMHWP
ncbi:hypothetical protein ACLMJK_006444, partial [Lecanora helva]